LKQHEAHTHTIIERQAPPGRASDRLHAYTWRITSRPQLRPDILHAYNMPSRSFAQRRPAKILRKSYGGPRLPSASPRMQPPPRLVPGLRTFGRSSPALLYWIHGQWCGGAPLASYFAAHSAARLVPAAPARLFTPRPPVSPAPGQLLHTAPCASCRRSGAYCSPRRPPLRFVGLRPLRSLRCARLTAAQGGSPHPQTTGVGKKKQRRKQATATTKKEVQKQKYNLPRGCGGRTAPTRACTFRAA
jgi:hypothetical protein